MTGQEMIRSLRFTDRPSRAMSARGLCDPTSQLAPFIRKLR